MHLKLKADRLTSTKMADLWEFFRERARACILDAIPEKETEEIKDLILLAQEEALAHGIVEIHSDDFKDVPTNYQKVIHAYRDLLMKEN